LDFGISKTRFSFHVGSNNNSPLIFAVLIYRWRIMTAIAVLAPQLGAAFFSHFSRRRATNQKDYKDYYEDCTDYRYNQFRISVIFYLRNHNTFEQKFG